MSSSGNRFTTEEILAILDFVATLDCEVFELQTEGLNLYVSKTEPGMAREPSAPQAQRREGGANQRRSAAVQSSEASAVEQREDDQGARRRSEIGDVASDDHHIITSPMVGTFYRASEPGSDPYVEVESIVRVGDTLCLLEVMKLFNTINTNVAGQVVAIYAKDGELVEYRQPLFAIDKSEGNDE